MQSNIFLYSFRRCPYAMRARMALKQSALKIELREIILKNKPGCMLQYSPKGTVPVLVENNNVIDESLEIMLWALQKNDPDHWLKNSEQSLELIKECDEQFKPILDSYKYNDQNKELQLQSKEKSFEFISKLDSILQSKKYLISDEIRLADIAIFPFIRQYAYVDIKWFEQCQFEYVKKWLFELIESQLFLSVMHKFPQYIESEETFYL